MAAVRALEYFAFVYNRLGNVKWILIGRTMKYYIGTTPNEKCSFIDGFFQKKVLNAVALKIYLMLSQCLHRLMGLVASNKINLSGFVCEYDEIVYGTSEINR